MHDSAIESIDWQKRLVYSGDEDSEAPEDSRDLLAVVVVHCTGEVRLPNAQETSRFVDWLCARRPEIASEIPLHLRPYVSGRDTA